jgi:hypothetical protein
MILSPLIRLSGHSRSQETKWSTFFHLLISHPASLRIVVAVMTSMPSIWARSVPIMRNKSARKPNCGVLPLLLFEPILPLLRWQTGTLTPVLSLMEILLKPPITFGHLLLAKLVTILFLLQQSVQECIVFNRLELALSETQTPRFVGSVSSRDSSSVVKTEGSIADTWHE